MLELNLPTAHAAQLLVPVERPLKVPTTHCAHTVEVVAEATLLYWPALHAVHAFVPVVSELYVPTAHALHTEGAGL